MTDRFASKALRTSATRWFMRPGYCGSGFVPRLLAIDFQGISTPV